MPNMVKIFTVTIVLATNTKTLWLKMMLWKYETNHNQNTSREWRIYMGSGKEKNKWSTKRHSWNRNISCHGRQCVTAIWASQLYCNYWTLYCTVARRQGCKVTEQHVRFQRHHQLVY